jgi:hypothetical protein
MQPVRDALIEAVRSEFRKAEAMPGGWTHRGIAYSVGALGYPANVSFRRFA